MARSNHVRPRILCKSVLWATIVLSFGYGLQGAAGATCVLIWAAGVLHCRLAAGLALATCEQDI